jgi:hypothetical protein
MEYISIVVVGVVPRGAAIAGGFIGAFMKRAFSLLVVAVFVAAFSGSSGAATNAPAFAISGDARALELGIGDQGVTLGAAISVADSKPSAAGLAAGQCGLLGDNPDPTKVTCAETTTETSSFPGDGGKDGATCAAPALPDPLNTVLSIATACGSSQSGKAGAFAGTANEGQVAEAAVNLDLSGLSQQVEDVKDQVVDAIRGIVDQAPDPVKTALDQILDVIDAGQAGQLKIGTATSTISPTKDGVQVVSTATGAVVGVLGIPDLNAQGNPIPGTADATEDGLLIVEIGTSETTVAVDTDAATAKAAASPAIVTLKVRDITQAQPTYTEIPVAPGETQTVLEGTPLESTVIAADSVIENKGTTAAAASNAVRLDLIKGVQGGIHLALGRTTGAARVQAAPQEPPVQPEPEEPPLPVTGARNLVPLGLLLLAGAAWLLWARRRVD